MVLSQSTLYLREYFYTTLNGIDVEYRALSYKELEGIQNKYTNKKNQSTITIVKQSLINKEDFIYLTQKDLDILFTHVVDNSIVTNADMETIKTAVNISLEDNFKDDTFRSCKLCQEKGLDKQRNCPMLDEVTHDKMVFYIINNAKVHVCPMDSINSPLVNDAFRAYTMYDNGFLPTEGGLYDQSMFFVEVSSLIKGLINSHQSKMMYKK